MSIIPLEPHLDPQVEVFQGGVVTGILNFKVTFRLIHTFLTFLTPLFEGIFGSLDFSPRNTY